MSFSVMASSERVVAHRGGAGLAPENTLRAFSLSYALGVRLLETDAQVTSDGVVIAFHDTTLERTTGLAGRVRDHTWAQLRSVRVGGEPLVRLDTLIEAFPDASFLVDVKHAALVRPLTDVIRHTRSAHRVCVADGRDGWLRALTESTGCTRSLGWGSLTRLMLSAKVGVTPRLTADHGAFAAHIATRLGGLAWMADPRAAARLVAMSHDVGLRLITWTVNEPEQMTRYLDTGADAVITDRPDLLREILVRRGEWRRAEVSGHRQTSNVTALPRLTTTPTASPSLSA